MFANTAFYNSPRVVKTGGPFTLDGNSRIVHKESGNVFGDDNPAILVDRLSGVVSYGTRSSVIGRYKTLRAGLPESHVQDFVILTLTHGEDGVNALNMAVHNPTVFADRIERVRDLEGVSA